jgi:hypothetical protein|tara:strand:+ start:11986 stop:12255 length:270 start_codon:yes stop_codon:yes gene_type:complete
MKQRDEEKATAFAEEVERRLRRAQSQDEEELAMGKQSARVRDQSGFGASPSKKNAPAERNPSTRPKTHTQRNFAVNNPRVTIALVPGHW